MTNEFKSDLLKKILGGRIIYLVGMMGSGKSLTGPYLAKFLDYSFVDQDNVIEELTKQSIAEIFQQQGEQEFREIETKVLKEIGTHHSLVVATGGGVVMSSENWGVLHQGIVIWINPSQECLAKRLEYDRSKRPLLKTNNFLSTLDELSRERFPFYSEADLQIIVEKETPEELSLEICKQLSSVLSDPFEKAE